LWAVDVFEGRSVVGAWEAGDEISRAVAFVVLIVADRTREAAYRRSRNIVCAEVPLGGGLVAGYMRDVREVAACACELCFWR